MLSIVVPVYRGEKTIRRLAEEINRSLTDGDDDWELIFIDDGSPDGSMDVIRSLAAEDRRTGWISFEGNRGQQTAVLCGLRESRGDYIVTMDDDLEHPVEIISRLSAEILKGYDAVYAVAEKTGGTGGFFRDAFFSLVLRKPSALRIGSFRIFTREAADQIVAAEQPFVYISAELFRHGLSAASITYSPVSTREQSRYRFRTRLMLYLRLLLWYGPLTGAILRAAAGRSRRPQYVVRERGGCLC